MHRIAYLASAALLTSIAASVTACSDGVIAPVITDLAASEVRVSPPTQVVAVWGTARFTVSVYPASGVTDRTVTWSSSDSTVARVDQTGTVTGVKAGLATITATSNQNPAVVGAGVVTVVPGFGWGVTIAAINTEVCTTSAGCASVPANVTAIAGRMDVVLSFEPNGEIIKSAQATLTCGGKSLSAERTDLDVAPAPQSARMEVTLSINTLEADSTGARKLPNGECTLSVSVSTASGLQSGPTRKYLTLKNTT